MKKLFVLLFAISFCWSYALAQNDLPLPKVLIKGKVEVPDVDFRFSKCIVSLQDSTQQMSVPVDFFGDFQMRLPLGEANLICKIPNKDQIQISILVQPKDMGTVIFTLPPDTVELEIDELAFDLDEAEISGTVVRKTEVQIAQLVISEKKISRIATVAGTAVPFISLKKGKRKRRSKKNQPSTCWNDGSKSKPKARNGGFQNIFGTDDSNQEDKASGERYAKNKRNGFINSQDENTSTFSIDVDKASYSNVRRLINYGEKPPKDAVRVEEMINYFDYDYPTPIDGSAFAVNTTYSECPWNTANGLVQIGIKGMEVDASQLPKQNLVFLVDVSGSMSASNKLPLVQTSLKMLLDELKPNDQISLVTYAGSVNLVLNPTPVSQKERIIQAIDMLSSGGGTYGAGGIQLAYQTAEIGKTPNGNNRIILCTDGDFNVGTSDKNELGELMKEKRKSGTFMTVLGYGMGNLQDEILETLADKGNGNYAYIDSKKEAENMLVNQMTGTLLTIAKDVKIQVEFNPAYVESYRLVGYENRMLDNKDFEDDTKDAGELGAGHSVTAFYEVVPTPLAERKRINDINTWLTKQGTSGHDGEDNAEYARIAEQRAETELDKLISVQLRFKRPDSNKSEFVVHNVTARFTPMAKAAEHFQFAAAVAEFGMVLSDYKAKNTASAENAKNNAKNALGFDPHGNRAEFLELIDKYLEMVATK